MTNNGANRPDIVLKQALGEQYNNLADMVHRTAPHDNGIQGQLFASAVEVIAGQPDLTQQGALAVFNAAYARTFPNAHQVPPVDVALWQAQMEQADRQPGALQWGRGDD